MMSNGGGGGGGGGGAGDGKSNVNGGGRTRDHQQVEEGEEDHEALMKNFPTGYRFKPTDEELIKYYLYRKVNRLGLPPNLIKDVNIYAFHPSELSDRYRSYGDNEFYFFTPRERKYWNGKRPNRAANGGYWKASGTDQPVIDAKTNEKIGYKRSLVFYRGKPPKADSEKAENLRKNKSDWLMHEYTLEKLKEQEKDKRPFTDAGSSNHKQLNEFILCKLYMKRGKSTKDIKYPGHDQCKDKAVDAAAPPSIANATSSAAAVPEDRHQLHQTAAVVTAAVVGDHQYLLTSRVATAAAEGMVPEYQHYMCQTDGVAVGNHQNSLTSMVLEAVAQEEMLPFNYNCSYLDNGNLSFSSAPSAAISPSVNQHYYGEMDQQQLQPAILPSVNHHIYGEMNQHQLQPAVLPSVNQHGQMNHHQLQPAVLPSVNQHTNGQMNHQQLQPAVLPSVNQHTNGQMNQQQLDEDYVFEMFVADLKNIGLQPNSSFFSLPDLRTDISPR